MMREFVFQGGANAKAKQTDTSAEMEIRMCSRKAEIVGS